MRLSDRLVYVTETGDKYHHRPHHRSYSVTWTQRFAETGYGAQPCQVCFRGRRPRHRGRLVEEPAGVTGALTGIRFEPAR